MKIILIGPPGVGKGTQAQKLQQSHGLRQISTGDLLRTAISNRTTLGMTAERYINRGELVPDDVMLELIEETLFGENAPDAFTLDGFPRTVPQAEGLENIFTRYGARLDCVILLEADHDLIARRLAARRTCRQCNAVYNLLTNPPHQPGRCDACGGELYQRPDDQLATIANRLRIYREQTAPLVEFYRERQLLSAVDALGPSDAVYQRIEKLIGGK